jgi:hypothetical protein
MAGEIEPETFTVKFTLNRLGSQEAEYESGPVLYGETASERVQAEAKAIAQVIEKASSAHGVNRNQFLREVKTALTTCIEKQ